MLQDCKPLSEWMGLSAWNASEVGRRIYIDGIDTGDAGDPSKEVFTPEDMQRIRPYVMLYPEATAGYRFVSDASPNCWSNSGTIVIVFSRSYDASLTINDHFEAVAASIEKVISNDDQSAPGLLEMSRTAGYLPIRTLQVYFVGRTEKEQIETYGDAYDVVFVLEYGQQ